MNSLVLFWKKNKSLIVYILALFLVTRIVLMSVGAATQHFLPLEHYQNWKKELVQEHKSLSLWATFDSKWYLQMTDHGYAVTKPFNPRIQQPIAFYPLYPIFIFCISWIFNPLVAGIIVSNVALIIGSFLFYKLVALDYGEDTAKRSLWYLYLFPTAYIFSAVYAESVLLLFTVGTLLAARQNKWRLAGALGFFAAIAKPVGIIILIPVVFMYLKNVGYSWKKITPQAFYIGLIPLGFFCFMLYGYHITGDIFFHINIEKYAWGHRLSNPLWIIWKHFTFGDGVDLFINSLAPVTAIILLVWGFRKILFSYWIYALLLVLFAPVSGTVWAAPRYMATIFPILIILAIFGKNENADKSIVTCMAILQGFLAVFWFAGFWFTA